MTENLTVGPNVITKSGPSSYKRAFPSATIGNKLFEGGKIPHYLEVYLPYLLYLFQATVLAVLVGLLMFSVFSVLINDAV